VISRCNTTVVLVISLVASVGAQEWTPAQVDSFVDKHREEYVLSQDSVEWLVEVIFETDNPSDYYRFRLNDYEVWAVDMVNLYLPDTIRTRIPIRLLPVLRTQPFARKVSPLDWWLFARLHCRNQKGQCPIDTSGPDPTVLVTISTNGDFSQLDSIGVPPGLFGRQGNRILTEVPIRLIACLRGLPTIEHVVPHWHDDMVVNRSAGGGPAEIHITINSFDYEMDATVKVSFYSNDNRVDMRGPPAALDLVRHAELDSSNAIRFDDIPPGVYNCMVEIASGSPANRLQSTRTACRFHLIQNLQLVAGTPLYIQLSGETTVSHTNLDTCRHELTVDTTFKQ
jgi:hypothetical protein